MTQETMVGDVSANAGTLKDRAKIIASVVEKMVNGTFSDDEIKRFDNRVNPFSPARLSKSQREMWEKFYQKEFGKTVDLSQVTVPDNPGGFDRVIVVAKGITIGMALAVCRSYFKVWTYRDDLDAAVTWNERTAEAGSYAIRVRDRVEADEELKNLSGNEIKNQNLTTETLLERLLHELKFFKETGKHLDINNWTLCTGSRGQDGDVPHVCWSTARGELRVHWYFPDLRNDILRSRAVAS